MNGGIRANAGQGELGQGELGQGELGQNAGGGLLENSDRQRNSEMVFPLATQAAHAVEISIDDAADDKEFSSRRRRRVSRDQTDGLEHPSHAQTQPAATKHMVNCKILAQLRCLWLQLMRPSDPSTRKHKANGSLPAQCTASQGGVRRLIFSHSVS